MSKVLLISEKTLKESTIINDNIDPMYIGPAIESAQNIGLQQIIGTRLLNKLCDLVETGEINDNPNYKELLDGYITDYLKYKTCSEITLLLGYKYRNAGVIQTDSENIHNSYMKDAQFMSNHFEDQSNFFAMRLVTYLNHNRSKFPEYGCGKCEDLKPGNNFDTGIYLN